MGKIWEYVNNNMVGEGRREKWRVSDLPCVRWRRKSRKRRQDIFRLFFINSPKCPTPFEYLWAYLYRQFDDTNGYEGVACDNGPLSFRPAWTLDRTRLWSTLSAYWGRKAWGRLGPEVVWKARCRRTVWPRTNSTRERFGKSARLSELYTTREIVDVVGWVTHNFYYYFVIILGLTNS